jgi:hypothetical protein
MKKIFLILSSLFVFLVGCDTTPENAKNNIVILEDSIRNAYEHKVILFEVADTSKATHSFGDQAFFVKKTVTFLMTGDDIPTPSKNGSVLTVKGDCYSDFGYCFKIDEDNKFYITFYL